MIMSLQNKNNLGDRMKHYEAVSKSHILPRTPAIIRLDGKAMHTWCKGLDKPFDSTFIAIMANTMKYVVDNIHGAVFAYCQSDEISILLRDYDNLNSEPWFGGQIQKIVSVSASLATAKFNSLAAEAFENKPLALFDSRVFNIPREEVVNAFIFRQQDAVRNSIRALASHTLGHKKCHGLNNQQVQDEMMKLDNPVNWNDLPIHKKRGIGYNSTSKAIDSLIPIFTQSRDYVGIHIEKVETDSIEDLQE